MLDIDSASLYKGGQIQKITHTMLLSVHDVLEDVVNGTPATVIMQAMIKSFIQKSLATEHAMGYSLRTIVTRAYAEPRI